VASRLLSRGGQGRRGRCSCRRGPPAGPPPAAVGGVAPDTAVLCPDLGATWCEVHVLRRDGDRWPNGGGGGLGGR
jgi:hypothetical protein